MVKFNQMKLKSENRRVIQPSFQMKFRNAPKSVSTEMTVVAAIN